jgi:3-hydroxybutyryl-CoA dehydratase
MAAGDALASVEHLITQDAVSAYAEASGDFNPIHIDAEFASGSHFGRRIAHGMMIAATVSELMAGAFGLDWARSGKLKLRFRAPVFPGDRIQARGTIKKIEDLEEGGRRITCTVVTVRVLPDSDKGDPGEGDPEEVAITAQASVVVA